MKTRTSSRSRRSAAQWASLVKQYESSSLTVAEFCEQFEVSMARLIHWRDKLRGTDERKERGFTPVRLHAVAAPPPPTAPSAIELRLTNGRMLRVTGTVDVQTLRAVMQAAEGGTAC
jgi:transposase-like protein